MVRYFHYFEKIEKNDTAKKFLFCHGVLFEDQPQMRGQSEKAILAAGPESSVEYLLSIVDRYKVAYI